MLFCNANLFVFEKHLKEMTALNSPIVEHSERRYFSYRLILLNLSLLVQDRIERSSRTHDPVMTIRFFRGYIRVHIGWSRNRFSKLAQL